jgi:two-component system CheB/CheR fusion protein
MKEKKDSSNFNKTNSKDLLKSQKGSSLKNSSVFPIVGIGASAGGLDALEHFFQNLPANCGMAFVVIQHLDPDHIGIMPELLQRISEMKVIEATDRCKIMQNHIYILPPNKSMSVLNGALHLFEPIEARCLRLPIDFFFRSLAEDQKEKSIGIILSGMGSDGSIGIKAIKEKNGLVLVQDPKTAKFDGMPTSAINSVLVDIIASASELAIKLFKTIQHEQLVPLIDESNQQNLSSIEKIIILLRTNSGHDFSSYKKNTIHRRIERRMYLHQIENIEMYIRYLQENPNELNILFKELLIGVTNFFRDPAVWETLKNKILPEIFEKLPNGYIFRVWVTACSTGEEAYTIAIILREAFSKIKTIKNITFQIFATDIDDDAIEIARKGFFTSNITSDVSEERLNNYFNPYENGYKIKNSIRERVVFAPQNIIKDSPFTKLDLISCRNLLIYLELDLQKKLMQLFHYSLNKGGIMILGSAESENSKQSSFEILDPKLKFFKKSGASNYNHIIDFPSSFSNKKNVPNEPKSIMKAINNIQTITDQILIERFTPASVLINDQGDILYITGRTGKYLEPAAGKANMNIFAMARQGLNNELPGALRKAKLSFDPLLLTNIKIGSLDDSITVNVTIQQLERPEEIKGNFLIVFDNVIVQSKVKTSRKSKGSKTAPILELEFELQRANEDLQSTREEMQTSQEELKSTNEELQSTNEELQSTNEELTTSKEEMQSLNEELQNVNNELQYKISDFVRANDDMKNLLNSTDIGTLFLDKDLNIRRFTDKLTKIFKFRQSDIGRPFTDMVSDLNYPDLESHAAEVLQNLAYKVTPISTFDNRWFNVRIMPYRTMDDRIDGLVITFIDITNEKKLELELKNALKIIKDNNYSKSIEGLNNE